MINKAKRQKMSTVYLEDLPDEILLKIFQHLSTKEIVYCAQMSKRIRKISHDESLWQKINLYQRKVRVEFVEQILSNGCKYLSLNCAELLGDIKVQSRFEFSGWAFKLSYVVLMYTSVCRFKSQPY